MAKKICSSLFFLTTTAARGARRWWRRDARVALQKCPPSKTSPLKMEHLGAKKKKKSANYVNNKNERRPIRNQRWGNLSAVPEGRTCLTERKVRPYKLTKGWRRYSPRPKACCPKPPYATRRAAAKAYHQTATATAAAAAAARASAAAAAAVSGTGKD